ncbi:MAG: 2-dehydro-3-deoxyphosphooctonate aldolase [Rhodobacteraceae bacterium]|nr:MAG: 2-dehydro-3-deoxyphosphooctonate aldolase [Paracoccaceae bacterium]|tara:strand:- start:1136 stop:1567 length:432 start_codon:yes stop_codon:yes gene_type:complete
MSEKSELSPLLSIEDSLVAIMIAEGLSDETISTRELLSISRIVDHLPIFQHYDQARVQTVAQIVFDLFEEEDGLDALFGLVKHALPENLYETAYALACDVAACDGRLLELELQMLKEIRYELNIDRLNAAAIERGARARHQKI